MTSEELLFMMYIEDQEKQKKETTEENENHSWSGTEAPGTEKNN